MPLDTCVFTEAGPAAIPEILSRCKESGRVEQSDPDSGT